MKSVLRNLNEREKTVLREHYNRTKAMDPQTMIQLLQPPVHHRLLLQKANANEHGLKAEDAGDNMTGTV
jgi:hypothetical protein